MSYRNRTLPGSRESGDEARYMCVCLYKYLNKLMHMATAAAHLYVKLLSLTHCLLSKIVLSPLDLIFYVIIHLLIFKHKLNCLFC